MKEMAAPDVEHVPLAVELAGQDALRIADERGFFAGLDYGVHARLLPAGRLPRGKLETTGCHACPPRFGICPKTANATCPEPGERGGPAGIARQRFQGSP